MEKFAVQVLSMTNQCNLKCTYCDWEKHNHHKLTAKDISTASENIKQLKKMIVNDYPSAKLIEYSGGEVTLYPELLNIMLDTFDSYWFRIVTNGTLLTDSIIDKIKTRGKVFVALSLDGDSIESNSTRFGNNVKLFELVKSNLGILLSNNIPVMLLCTINSTNISNFHSFMQYLESNYSRYINDGKLFLPAHYVFNYNGDNGTPSEKQKYKFIGYLETTNDLMVKHLSTHYQNLSYFLENHKHLHDCHIPEWCLPVHFRGNSIIESGLFHSFGCGMRGKLDFGDIDVHNPVLFKQKAEDINLLDSVRFCDGENCEHYCFVDWFIVDLILQGIIPLELAQKWFVFFRDPDIVSYIKNPINKIDVTKYTYTTEKTCAKTIDLVIDNNTNTIKYVKFNGGCAANQIGISNLCKNKPATDIIKSLKGIDCQCKGTSCPDQLAKALEYYLSNKEQKQKLFNDV